MNNTQVIKAAAKVVVDEYRQTGSYDDETDLEIINHVRNTVVLPGIFVPGGWPLEIDDEENTNRFAFAIVIDASTEDIERVLTQPVDPHGRMVGDVLIPIDSPNEQVITEIAINPQALGASRVMYRVRPYARPDATPMWRSAETFRSN